MRDLAGAVLTDIVGKRAPARISTERKVSFRLPTAPGGLVATIMAGVAPQLDVRALAILTYWGTVTEQVVIIT